MEYTDLEREYDRLQDDYNELQKDYDNLLIVNDKLQSDYNDLDYDLSAMESRVDHLVESKVVTLLYKMESFNNYYSEYSSVKECGDLLFHLTVDIEEYYNHMSMSVTEIVETNVLGIDILLTFYSYTLTYNIQTWLKKLIIEEFINKMKRQYSSSFIIHLNGVQRRALRDILTSDKIVFTNKFYFPKNQEHVCIILELICTNFSAQFLYDHNKQYFNKEIIESLDIDQELKENILFQYKKDILKGNIK